MIHRAGKPPRSDVRYKVRPGAYVIAARGRQVLLTHQNSPHPEFQLPGGGIDPGEQPLAALHREVLEETGWRLGGVQRLGVYRRFTYMPEYTLWAEKVCHVYAARPVSRLGLPSEKGHVAIWMPASLACESVASEGDRQFLKAWMQFSRAR